MTNLVPSEQIFIGDKEKALVKKYNYLGHEILILRGNQTCEIKRRVTLSWAAYGGWRTVFKSDMPQCWKRKVFDQCVLPVMTYGAETLTLTTASAVVSVTYGNTAQDGKVYARGVIAGSYKK